MVEVIVRNLDKIEKDGTEIWKVKKLLSKYSSFGQQQVSLNSDNHLVVRLRDEYQEEDIPHREEILIVFNMIETREIVDYLKNTIANTNRKRLQ